MYTTILNNFIGSMVGFKSTPTQKPLFSMEQNGTDLKLLISYKSTI
ncbi:MAG: hypothetical protein V4456_03215 [Bacteroidota bacterium]